MGEMMSRQHLEELANGWRGSESEINVSEADCKELGVKCSSISKTMKASEFVSLVDKMADRDIEQRRRIKSSPKTIA